MAQEDSLTELAAELVSGRKYRDLDFPIETLTDLLRDELIHTGAGDPPYDLRRRPVRQAFDKARSKLHNIAALYLGDPDYHQAIQDLNAAWNPGIPPVVQLDLLRALMAQHASSRERLPVLENLYPRLWSITGVPHVIYDLACALHPLSLPWMGLPSGAHYLAYDLHLPRVNLLNHFFTLASTEVDAIAFQRDILISPPNQPADVAFILKEVHRFEQRRPGCSVHLLQALQNAGVRWVIISLPENPLSKVQYPQKQRTQSLATSYQRLLYKLLSSARLPMPQEQLTLAGEMFFFLCLN